MKTATVSLTLKEFRVMASVGETVTVWGMKFIVNQVRDCVCDLPIDQAEAAAAAGRVKIIKVNELPDLDVNEVKLPAPLAVDEYFGLDPKDWFGVGDAEDFRKHISKLTKWQLIDFANTRLGIIMVPTSSKSKLIADICNMTNNLAGAA